MFNLYEVLFKIRDDSCFQYRLCSLFTKIFFSDYLPYSRATQSVATASRFPSSVNTAQ